MQQLQTDVRSNQARTLLPRMLPALAGASRDAAGERSRELLDGWARDPEQAASAAAPLIFEQWYIELADAVFEPVLGNEVHQRLKGASYVLNHALDSLLMLAEDDRLARFWWQGRREQILAGSFDAALATLRARLGDDLSGWRWEALHQLHFEHMLGDAAPLLDRLFNRGPFPWGGGNVTVGRARYGYNEPFAARAGANFRMVTELSQPIRARAVVPGGQAGHPLSPHYDDQLPGFLAGELYPLADSPEAIGAPRTRLEPAAQR